MSVPEEIREMLEVAKNDHIDEYHSFSADDVKIMVEAHEELVKTVPENKILLERVIEVLDGTPEYDLYNKQTGRTGGMVAKQNLIERELASIKYAGNGGTGFSVRNKDKLIIGAIAAVPAIVSLIIGLVAISQYGGSP
jgi:hypothetical protein